MKPLFKKFPHDITYSYPKKDDKKQCNEVKPKHLSTSILILSVEMCNFLYR
ncbi:protein of unknown function [Ruminococcaceae bacterium BL-6]|nr:protein of unknown function [Ruminococcaceae bacterium BL-6]